MPNLYHSLSDRVGYTADDARAAMAYGQRYGAGRGGVGQQEAFNRLGRGGQKAWQDVQGNYAPDTPAAAPTVPARPSPLMWGGDATGVPAPTFSGSRPRATPLVLDPQSAANDRIEAATYGQGDALMTDPRLTAALDRIQGVAEGKDTSLYSQLTDASAAQAGSQADTLRQQLARAGIGMDDPAAQARFRELETARMQSNNGALAQQNQYAQSAAGQLAQMRLGQIQAANQMYAQGANMESRQMHGQSFVPSGYQPTVPQFQPQNQQSQSNQQSTYQPWRPPAGQQTDTQTPTQPEAPQSPNAMTNWNPWGTTEGQKQTGPVMPNGQFTTWTGYSNQLQQPPRAEDLFPDYYNV